MHSMMRLVLCTRDSQFSVFGQYYPGLFINTLGGIYEYYNFKIARS